MPSPPKKTRLKDIDKEDNVSMEQALGDLREAALQVAGSHPIIPGELTELDGVPVPTADDLASPDAAIAWAQQKLAEATPRAVQEVIYQLKRGGTAKERAAMALQILDRSGVKEKAGPTTVAPIFLLTPESVKNIPWVKKAKELGEIVNGAIDKSAAGSIIEGEVIDVSTPNRPRETASRQPSTTATKDP